VKADAISQTGKLEDQPLIDGRLAQRTERNRENAERRARRAIRSNDREALDRVLDACGSRGERVGSPPRAARIVLFTATNCGTTSWPSDARQRGL